MEEHGHPNLEWLSDQPWFTVVVVGSPLTKTEVTVQPPLYSIVSNLTAVLIFF
jgi:hypothetical protein